METKREWIDPIDRRNRTENTGNCFAAVLELIALMPDSDAAITSRRIFPVATHRTISEFAPNEDDPDAPRYRRNFVKRKRDVRRNPFHRVYLVQLTKNVKRKK